MSAMSGPSVTRSVRLSIAHRERLSLLRDRDPRRYGLRHLLERLIDRLYEKEFPAQERAEGAERPNKQ